MERWIDENAIELYWKARFDDSIPGIKRRFRHDDIYEVVEDIVRIREDQGCFELTPAVAPIELVGIDGPIHISPRFSTDHIGGFMVDIRQHDEDDNPISLDSWQLIPPGDGRRRTQLFRGSQLLSSIATGSDIPSVPMELSPVKLSSGNIATWVEYLWQAHMDTPPDF